MWIEKAGRPDWAKTTAPVQAAAAGPEIKDPTLTQQLMLDAPFGDDLCVLSVRGTGKSWGIVMLVARDAAHWKERYKFLITRTTYEGLTELQGLLWCYLSVAFPGTTYSGEDMAFRGLAARTCLAAGWSSPKPVLGRRRVRAAEALPAAVTGAVAAIGRDSD